MTSTPATPTPDQPATPDSGTAVGIGCSELVLLRGLKWEDDGPDRIRGYMDSPKTTLFIIERHPTKPYRGRMTGAVIPDEDEKPDGLLANALITWLQGCAAPQYLAEFHARLIGLRDLQNVTSEPRSYVARSVRSTIRDTYDRWLYCLVRLRSFFSKNYGLIAYTVAVIVQWIIILWRW